MATETSQVLNATCPDCRGPLTQIKNGNLTEYRCLVGHRFSALSALNQHCDAEEKALWAAVVALEETEALVDSMAGFLEPGLAERLRNQAQDKKRLGEEVRGIIQRLQRFHTD